MGITGLLPYLSKAITLNPLKKYKNCTIAIDTYSWLYQILTFYSEDLFHNLKTTSYITRLEYKIKALLQNDITPIFIFDGDPLKSKQTTNQTRKEKKDKIIKEVYQLLKKDYKRAKELMKQCISVTNEIVNETICYLQSRNLQYMIAPYESDAQMCYLQRIGYVDYIMTEDSDLIVFGCDKILYKYDCANVQEYDKDKDVQGKVFSDYVMEICIMSGCDYLPSIKGVGLKTAHNMFKQTQSYEEVIERLKVKKDVPLGYKEEYERALVTFKEQIVYDPIKRTRLHLSGKERLDDERCYEFLGRLDVEDAFDFSQGMKSIEVSTIEESQMDKAVNHKQVNEQTVKKRKRTIVDDNEYSPFFN